MKYLFPLLTVITVSGVLFGACARTAPQAGAPTTAPTTQTAVAVPSDNIYLQKTDATKGGYLSDFAGMTLYTFDNDQPGTSTCTGSCAALWPAYTSGATAQSQFPTNISVIKRPDGSPQFAWKGKPLYYYSPDKKEGDLLGDGIGGVWHIVKP